MGNIVIYHKNGDPLQAKALITKAEQVTQLLSQDVIKFELSAAVPVDFAIGDFVDYCGKTYTLNQLPTAKKVNSRTFTYTATFEGEQYELMDSAWILPANTYGDSFTGNLGDFLDILIENVGRTEKLWQIGTYPADTEVKTLTYTQTNCLAVLQNLCKEYGVEFEITRQGQARILNLYAKVGGEFATPFEYGRTGGAYNIERKTSSNKNVITKLFVFGSDKNLPATYRENKLCLPNKTRNESFITDSESVRLYGIKENLKVFSNIYPCRYGKVSAIVESDKNSFFDNTMDFDINETKPDGSTKWLIAGSVAKIQFTSGSLAGYSFDIVSYNHNEKKFRIKTYTDPNGLKFPNDSSAAFQIKENDEYFISDIRVPDSYVTTAENKLKDEAEKWFEENCKPQVEYNIEIDSFFLKNIYGIEETTTEIFRPGQLVTIHDADLEMDKMLRISGFTRDLLNPFKFKIKIAEKVQITTAAQRVISEISEIKEVVRINDLSNPAKAKRNWQTTQDVINSVFDPDGDYYTEKIKPGSIETQLLAVGARAQQFILKNVSIEANYAGDPNTIHNTDGFLEHYTILDDSVKAWSISEGTQSELDAGALYYIYAKCDRTGDVGVIVYDKEQHLVDSDPQFYYFLCGTITPVMADEDGERPARNIALSYGNTNVNGRFVNTGRIQSQDGKVWMDLDNGEIGGNIDFQDSVITETILIKNGKNSEGDTQYCGAISGNSDYPVMWVSDQSTTDMDAVKDLANESCPVKITKNGIGSNIGCLNVVSKNNVDVYGEDGSVKISSNDINTENSYLSPIIIPDRESTGWSFVDGRELKFTSPNTISLIKNSDITLLYENANNHTINITSLENGYFGVSATLRRVRDMHEAMVNVEIKRTLNTYISTDGGRTWTNISSLNVSKSTIAISKDVAEAKYYSLNFVVKGSSLRIRQTSILDVVVKYKGQAEPFTLYVTMDGDFICYPKLHFSDIVKSNIMAIGGYTCSLNSDNYFKLYPSGGKLQLDMCCTYAMQNVSLNASASDGQSYIDGYRFGPVVFIKFKILWQHLGGSALRLPTWARPYTVCDGNTWDNYNFSVNSDGNITSPNLPSSKTLWGCVTYITTANH